MQHPGEIDEIFDTISYNKGASVIRMLHQYVGDQVSYYQDFISPSITGTTVKQKLLD